LDSALIVMDEDPLSAPFLGAGTPYGGRTKLAEACRPNYFSVFTDTPKTLALPSKQQAQRVDIAIQGAKNRAN